jgi:hypothetical protein
MRICGWSASLVVAVIVSSAGQSPSPPRRLPPQGTIATSSATQPASSVALVSWVTRYSHDGMHALELLVVWRGEPGWFLRSGPRSSSAGGSGSSFHSTSQFGDVALRLDFDSATHVAEIQGQRVDLGDSNVVLVDNVDRLDGLRISGLLHVDSEVALLGGGHPDIDAVLMRSADIVSFLKCDVALPGGRGPGLVASTCARVIREEPKAGR